MNQVQIPLPKSNPEEWTIYTTKDCRKCQSSSTLLSNTSQKHRNIDVETFGGKKKIKAILKQKYKVSKECNLPIVFIGDHYLGTYKDLCEYLE